MLTMPGDRRGRTPGTEHRTRVVFGNAMKPNHKVERISDAYFVKAQTTVRAAGRNPRVLYQVFQRGESLLCGMKYVLPLLKQAAGAEILGLEDGDEIAPLESVLHITGSVEELLPYETVYLGLLARMTRVATNVRAAVKAANGKPVLFFPARFDAPEVQEYDGYAAWIGGAAGASTEAGAKAFQSPAVGTMPHALIAAFAGNTVHATIALAERFPSEPIWSLVDFENDSARTSVEVFRAFRDRGLKLTGVRLDTSQSLVDEGLRRMGMQENGVTASLVRLVRKALDEAGGHEVKIAVSGGFTPEKIARFEAERVPVDVYALGESLLRGSVPFTSDIIGYYDGENRFHPCAKMGREYRSNPRLRKLAG